ncbi:MAG: MetQ/NlpA family ABC transporter substrate-binding protein [Intestinimonas sp.]|jgi:D-methionine transport system substrate-binding protein|nr:MetQ/NlpA family ABC transporter substrate-binding protein [Intestinimonas sp.]
MKKKILAAALALVLGLSLAACGDSVSSSTPAPSASSESTTPAPSASGKMTVLKVAASATPHAEILAQVKDVLAQQGIDLQVSVYGDYVVPNTAVEDGLEDANYFQHQPYLDEFNKENGTHLVSVAAIHYEPFGIYPGRCKSLADLPDGATIGVPNDATNEARALQLLQAQDLITLKEDAGLNATPNDIVDNPKNLNFLELEAAMIPNVTSEVDLAVINGNYALQAGFSSAKDALALEDAASEPAKTFANVIVVKQGHEDDPAVQALVAALKSDTVRDYINNTYNGNVLPIF